MPTRIQQTCWRAARYVATTLLRECHETGMAGWDAEELTHEGFLAAYAHADKCRDPDRLFAYACTCARRGIRRWLRRQAVVTQQEATVPGYGHLPEAVLATSGETALHALLDLRCAIAASPPCRQRILRYRILGSSWRHIAWHEGRASTTVFRQHRLCDGEENPQAFRNPRTQPHRSTKPRRTISASKGR